MKADRDHILPSATSDLHQQMQINPFTLRFPGSLEGAFLDSFFKNSVAMVRYSLLAGIVLYSLFGILDAQLLPAMKVKLWFIRFGLVVPVLACVIGLSFLSFFRKIWQGAITFAMVVAGVGIIIMIAIVPPPVNYNYYAGLILVFIWGYTFTRVRFIWATLGGWLIVGFYELVAMAISHTPFPILMSNNFFFISANLAGMFACYSIEYYARKDFFLAYLLEAEQDKIIAASRRLEKIVQERTHQLKKMNEELRQEIEERKRAEREREKLESQLRKAEKLEAIGTLAGGIAHDFNNLLMGIQGSISMALFAMEREHSQYERLKATEEYVRRGADLTKQLLGFARGGKYELKSSRLNELIEKNVYVFGRTKKEISISTSYADDLWMVEVDECQIEQVLLNMFVNAWQAMPAGGQLRIGTENVVVDASRVTTPGLVPGKYARISISDTGVGMDKATQERIFDPFFTTKEMGRGTGLGLASAYGIIKNHGGVIDVVSEKGHGSTFFIYLPASERVTPEPQEPSQEILRGNETVLLVDDEEMVLDVTGEMLKTLGYTLITAKDGREAVDIIKRNGNDIDVVILDMIMPGVGGGDTFKLAREINKDLKVILASGYSIDGQASQILDKGCKGFIQKPFDLKQLSNKIRDILDTN